MEIKCDRCESSFNVLEPACPKCGTVRSKEIKVFTSHTVSSGGTDFDSIDSLEKLPEAFRDLLKGRTLPYSSSASTSISVEERNGTGIVGSEIIATVNGKILSRELSLLVKEHLKSGIGKPFPQELQDRIAAETGGIPASPSIGGPRLAEPISGNSVPTFQPISRPDHFPAQAESKVGKVLLICFVLLGLLAAWFYLRH